LKLIDKKIKVKTIAGVLNEIVTPKLFYLQLYTINQPKGVSHEIKKLTGPKLTIHAASGE
jgi:hypothetical protein